MLAHSEAGRHFDSGREEGEESTHTGGADGEVPKPRVSLEVGVLGCASDGGWVRARRRGGLQVLPQSCVVATPVGQQHHRRTMPPPATIALFGVDGVGRPLCVYQPVRSSAEWGRGVY